MGAVLPDCFRSLLWGMLRFFPVLPALLVPLSPFLFRPDGGGLDGDAVLCHVARWDGSCVGYSLISLVVPPGEGQHATCESHEQDIDNHAVRVGGQHDDKRRDGLDDLGVVRALSCRSAY